MAKDINKADFFDMYRPLFTDKQQETMEMYYFSDLSLGEIAQETGITRQGVFNCIKKAEERLDELEAAMHLLRKNEELNKVIDWLELCIKENRSKDALLLMDKLRSIY